MELHTCLLEYLLEVVDGRRLIAGEGTGGGAPFGGAGTDLP